VTNTSLLISTPNLRTALRKNIIPLAIKNFNLRPCRCPHHSQKTCAMSVFQSYLSHRSLTTIEIAL